jgi:hypothetical protein
MALTEGQMVQKNALPRILLAAVICGLAAVPFIGGNPAFAQTAPANPTMTNVIPDGGSFAVHGRVAALNTAARTLTIRPSAGPALPMTVPASVSLADLSDGDHVSVHYTRTVAFVVGTPLAGTARPAETMAQVAQTPGGIGLGATVIVGRVVKVDGPGRFDVINVDGGGVYTIRVTDPARLAAVTALKVGDSLTVSVGALTLSSVASCDLFGLIC